MGEGLLRQRRNLIIICVLLWIMKFGGATFSKFSLAGFDISFKNPDVLPLSIWLAYAYFLYRYYQYFSHEGVKKLQEIFGKALEEKCESIICKIVKQQSPTNNDALRYSYSSLKSDNWVYKGYALGEYNTATSSSSVEHFEIPISRLKLWRGVLPAYLDATFRNSVVTDYILPFIFADYVLYYCGGNDWDGSLFRSF